MPEAGWVKVLNIKWGQMTNQNHLFGGQMKFDVVVGNPPYNSDIFREKPWCSFSKFAIQHADYVLFVTPTLWAYSIGGHVADLRKLMAPHLKYADLSISKYFPDVGEDISCWFYDSGYQGDTELVTKDNRKCLHNFSQRFIKEENQIFVRIEKKVINNPGWEWKTCMMPKQQLAEAGKYLIQFSASQALYSDVQPADYYAPKVFVNVSGNYWHKKNPKKYVRFMEEGVSGQLAQYLLVEDRTQGDNLVKLLHSKLFVLFVQFNPTMNTPFKYASSHLPKMDITRSWTDEELYQYFDLTPEEIEYVEKRVK